ncbi:MAG: HD domain-containing phosphohydrolase [Thermomicrobiales bacterium]
MLRSETLEPVALWDALRGLSLALDLVMGRRLGHAQATAFLGLQTGRRLGLGAAELADVALAALLKDAGCASSRTSFTAALGADDIAFHRQVLGMERYTPATFAALLWDLQHRQADRATGRVRRWTQALLGLSRYRQQFANRNAEAARLAEQLRCPVGAIAGVGAIGEHWDGSGNPGKRSVTAIPIAARLVAAAQLAAVWGEEAGPVEVAERLAGQAGGRLDPAVVRELGAILRGQGATEPGEWLDVQRVELAFAESPLQGDHSLTPPILARVFAEIVDAKSAFTARHSHRVAALAGAVASLAGATPEEVEAVLLAGLLHDLGKLAVSNLVLDKAGPLSDPEWAVLRRHPADSVRVLKAVPGWETIALWAGAHHERLDGRGYYLGRDGETIPRVGRWLAVADAFDAMTADRPYRQGMDPAEALRRLRAGSGAQFDAAAVDLLTVVVSRGAVPGGGIGIGDVPGSDAALATLDGTHADVVSPFASTPLGPHSVRH